MRRLLFPLLASVFLLSAGSCRKDRDDENNGNNDTGLKAYLHGDFNLTDVDYNGTLNGPIGSSPINGTGSNTSGNFDFNRGETVVYSMSTTMQASILGQSIPIPVNFAGNGSVKILSETRIEVEDNQSSTPRIFDVRDQDDNSITLRTDYEVDSLGFNIKLTMDLYLQK